MNNASFLKDLDKITYRIKNLELQNASINNQIMKMLDDVKKNKLSFEQYCESERIDVNNKENHHENRRNKIKIIQEHLTDWKQQNNITKDLSGN